MAEYTYENLEIAAQAMFAQMQKEQKFNRPWDLTKIDEIDFVNNDSEYGLFSSLLISARSSLGGTINPFFEGMIEALQFSGGRKTENYTAYTNLLGTAVNMYFLSHEKTQNFEQYDNVAKAVSMVLDNKKKASVPIRNKQTYQATELGEGFEDYMDFEFRVNDVNIHVTRKVGPNMKVKRYYGNFEDRLESEDTLGPILTLGGESRTPLSFEREIPIYSESSLYRFDEERAPMMAEPGIIQKLYSRLRQKFDGTQFTGWRMVYNKNAQ